MRVIAAFIMRGRLQAIIATAGLAVLALLLMPFSWPASYLSGGAVGLVTLIQGPKEGLLNAFGATVIVTVLGILVGQPTVAAGFAVILWLPVWILALVLFQSRSLASMLLVNVLLGMAVIIGVYLVVAEPAQWWYSHISQQLLPAMKESGMVISDEAALLASLEEASRLMTGAIAASVSFGLAVSLFVARWWQAVVSNRPGAFGEEFRSLKLGRAAALVALVLSLPALLTKGVLAEMSVNLLQVMLMTFMFQGLAVAHAIVNRLKANQAWLVMMYILIVFTTPYGLLVVAMIGVLDNGFDFRARFKPKS